MAITPRAFSSSVRLASLFSAPRALNEPVFWKSSHLSRAPRVRDESIGVRTRCCSTTGRARRTSSRSTIRAALPSARLLAGRFEEKDRARSGGIEAVDAAAAFDRDRDLNRGRFEPVLAEAVCLGSDD